MIAVIGIVVWVTLAAGIAAANNMDLWASGVVFALGFLTGVVVAVSR